MAGPDTTDSRKVDAAISLLPEPMERVARMAKGAFDHAAQARTPVQGMETKPGLSNPGNQVVSEAPAVSQESGVGDFLSDAKNGVRSAVTGNLDQKMNRLGL